MSEEEDNGRIVDELGRRKWNKDEFAKKAKNRLDDERQGITLPGYMGKKRYRPSDELDFHDSDEERAPLKPRNYDINLEERLHKRVLVTGSTPLDKQGGYYCEVCDMLVKDSASWLSHLNGIRHIRRCGMTMRPEKSTAEDVRRRMKEKKAEMQKAKEAELKKKDYEAELDERIQQRMEEEERRKQEKKEKRRRREKEKKMEEKRLKDDSTEEGFDPAIAAMMGFDGFGKKS